MEDTTNELTNKEKTIAPKGSRKGILLFIGLLLLIVAGVWFGRGSFGNASAAVVNEEVITRAEYNARVQQIESQYELQLQMGGGEQSVQDPEIQAQIRNLAMDELVNERLFLQAARDAGVEVSESEVESELDLQRESYPDEASYKSDLAAAGVTESELKENIRNQLTIIAYARSVIPEENYTVTDEELREIYNLNFGDAIGEEGSESGIPTFEEFSSANRAQFELQKLGMVVAPLIDELRANADIRIVVELPEVGVEQEQTQETVESEVDIPEIESEQVPLDETEESSTEAPEDTPAE